MSTKEYEKKRDFKKSPEPKGKKKSSGNQLSFVVQKHDASSLHYDFRLEMDGVLKSWAVPKGPSIHPEDKRLAIHVEDHPLDYGGFEGVIPEGEYGAGTVMVWDRGTWKPDGDPDEMYESGSMKFELKGERLKGGWALFKMKGRKSGGKEQWLLRKEKDKHVGRSKTPLVERETKSVASGRSIEEIASDEEEGDPPENPAKKAEELDRSKKQKLPEDVRPQLATLVDKAPEGDAWFHEIKFDGYRFLARIDGKNVQLLTRHGKDWSGKFPDLCESLAKLDVDQAILDGEAVVLNKEGKSDFQAMQNSLKGKHKRTVYYYLFDVLHLDGRDVRDAPLRERKQLLEGVLKNSRQEEPLRYSDHIEGSGPDFYEKACEKKLEGIICKRASAKYSSTRSRSWLKVKCSQRQEFVIGGFTEPSGSRRGFGAIYIGVYEDGKLMPAGKVGTGFSDEKLKELRSKFGSLERKTSPFDAEPEKSRTKVHWLTPELVAEVEFTEMTGDGRIRHPAFKGLRSDKDPKEVHREVPQQTESSQKKKDGNKEKQHAGVRLTHPDRVLYPEQDVTKKQLADYYEAVAEWMLPHVRKRPLSVVRCPKGRSEKCFFQKHLRDQMPDSLRPVEISEKQKKETYFYVRDTAGLISLVQLGVLEIHPWGSRIDNIEKPDQLVFDMDPDEGVSRDDLVAGVRLLRDVLADQGLESFLKISGGKGYHICVPIDRTKTWDEAKDICGKIAKTVAKENPKKFVATMSKEERKGKIFVDYLRNSRGATAVAPFSTRARTGAPVALPIAWDELVPSVDPNHYTIDRALSRLKNLKSDPWQGYFDVRQRLKNF